MDESQLKAKTEKPVSESPSLAIEGAPPASKLSGTVVALGFVSLLMDACSEMVATQTPLFLRYVLGAPAWVVGLIEGIAESVASLLRLFSGSISDRMGKRKPLTILGYSLGAISKPLMFLATGWHFVLALRFLDRVGKGLRSSPRDALVADVTAPGMRGRAFGLHRAMDSTGAVIGPLLGVLFLSHISGDLSHKLRLLFLFAGVPGFLAVATLLIFVREPPRTLASGLSKSIEKKPFFDFKWKDLPQKYRRFLLIELLFSLGNSSDAFLILQANRIGVSSLNLLWLSAAFNSVEATLGYAAGKLSDRVGRIPLILAGYVVFGAVYLGFGLLRLHMEWGVWMLFLLYGGHSTLSKGATKAYVADLSDPSKRGAQLGAYHTITGIALFPASLLAGFLFDWNPVAPFILSGTLALFCAGLFLATSSASK